MRLNLKAVEERVAPLAGRESYDRGTGMLPFLEFIDQEHPDKISPKAKRWIASRKAGSDD